MKHIKVSDLMTRVPVIIAPDTSLFDCARLMVKKKVGSLLLVREKKLVGFISQEDILWALVKKSEKDLSKIKAIDISPKKIAVTRPEATIEEAIKKMKQLRFERLPVINNGELEGIITIKDIISFHPEIYPELRELDSIKEEGSKLKLIKIAKSRQFIHEGICEECGNVDVLFKIDGRVICESCKNSM
jgi:CBS domain-containing protein